MENTVDIKEAYPGGDFSMKINMPVDIIGEVVKWNEDAGNTSLMFNVRQTAFYTGMQCEELAEKLVACGLPGMAQVVESLGQELKNGKYDACIRHGDWQEMLDADCDLMVVTIGSAMSQGADFKGAMNAVIGANEAKRWPDGKLIRNEQGKITKPPMWQAPNLEPYVYKGDPV